MSLIIATGSNIGDSINILEQAKNKLDEMYGLIAASRIYVSAAVDYENQPDFFNQVLEFHLPKKTPQEVMQELLALEKSYGRNRDIPKGPRTLDLDIIFWDVKKVDEPALIIPHPRWTERSFVVRPLMELPFFQSIKKYYKIPESFTVEAVPFR